VGSLTLIVLQVALQPGSTDKLVAGNNAVATLFRRVLSGEVAGIPNKASKTVGASTTGTGGTVTV